MNGQVNNGCLIRRLIKMKFYVEISDEDFENIWSEDGFKDIIIEKASDELVRRIFSNLHLDCRQIGQQIIKENKEKIIAQIIVDIEAKLTETIARKKELVEITPKASELSAISKENEKYFIDLIDKAIAKRFKSV